MLTRTTHLVLILTLGACAPKNMATDNDGDGYTSLTGDCWDNPSGPSGSDLSGADIHPDAEEIWYDGIDQNCDGLDDFDADGDGFVADAHVGLETRTLSDSGALPGGDCWDEPIGPAGSGAGGDDIHPGAGEVWYDGVDQDCGGEDDFDVDEDGFVPDAYKGETTAGLRPSGGLPAGDCWDDINLLPSSFKVMVGVTATGVPVDWTQPEAHEVHPDADDLWYDGVDQNCDAFNDFDQDGDGYATAHYPDRSGFPAGDDCADGDPDVDRYSEEVLALYGLMPADVSPGAEESWYDGLDQDCAEDDDCDADADGFTHDGGGNPVCVEDPSSALCDAPVCVAEDCDDDDPSRFPNDNPEIPYSGVDDNCDYTSGDGDADGDGYWAADYVDRVEDAGATPMDIPDGAEGDCDDASSGVYPGAVDHAYDGTDADCAGDDDFDRDGDGFVPSGYEGRTTDGVAGSGGLPGGDCDDDPTLRGEEIYPGAADAWYDGVDSDCGGEDDYDQDGDGHVGDAHAGLATAYVSASGSLPAGDCDDEDASRSPGLSEDCATSFDDDCDGDDNDIGATGCTDFFADRDGDGDGLGSDGRCTCEATPPYDATSSTDCDDDDAAVYSTAPEDCDAVDSDCDGSLTDGLYSDADGDGDPDCIDGDRDGDGYFVGSGPDEDCDDDNPDIHPGAEESCDEVDSDCDGSLVDEFDSDIDGDGTIDCMDSDADGDGSVALDAGGEDCDDADPDIHPGAADTWYDGVDSDCDGASDFDMDGDGHDADTEGGGDCDDDNPLVHPDAEDRGDTEDFDDDCDGWIDEDDVLDLLAAGEDVLVISEIQIHPVVEEGERNGEWFELYNASDLTVYLDNWRFVSATDDECLVGGTCRDFLVYDRPDVSVEPGGVLLFCLNKSYTDGILGGGACDYHWGWVYYGGVTSEYYDGSFRLPQDGASRTVQAFLEGVLVDEVDYGATSWPASPTEGVSYQVDGSTLTGSSDVRLSNDEFDVWCESVDVYDSSTTPVNTGSPGEVNPVCE